jgi:hypothetical protein
MISTAGKIIVKMVNHPPEFMSKTTILQVIIVNPKKLIPSSYTKDQMRNKLGKRVLISPLTIKKI